MSPQIKLLASKFRFHILFGTIILAVLFLAIAISQRVIPLFLQESQRQILSWKAIANSASLPAVRDSLSRENRKIVSALEEGKRKLQFNEAELLKQLYTTASSIGFSISKVELGDPVSAEGKTHYPIILAGAGSYNAVGKLISHIENIDQFSRITYCSIKKEPRYNSLGCFIEFMIIEGK